MVERARRRRTDQQASTIHEPTPLVVQRRVAELVAPQKLSSASRIPRATVTRGGDEDTDDATCPDHAIRPGASVRVYDRCSRSLSLSLSLFVAKSVPSFSRRERDDTTSVSETRARDLRRAIRRGERPYPFHPDLYPTTTRAPTSSLHPTSKRIPFAHLVPRVVGPCVGMNAVGSGDGAGLAVGNGLALGELVTVGENVEGGGGPLEDAQFRCGVSAWKAARPGLG